MSADIQEQANCCIYCGETIPLIYDCWGRPYFCQPFYCGKCYKKLGLDRILPSFEQLCCQTKEKLSVIVFSEK